MRLNKGEYGDTIYFDLQEDVSGATALAVVLQDPDGNESSKTATLGETALVTPKGTFTANYWCQYTIASGDIDEAGRWRIRATATFASRVAKTDWQPLVVKS